MTTLRVWLAVGLVGLATVGIWRLRSSPSHLQKLHKAARGGCSVEGQVTDERGRPLGRQEIHPQVPGEVPTSTLSLLEGKTLAGRVVDGEGRPVAEALVGASDLDVEATRSSTNGDFRLQGLGRDPVNVFAHAKGYATKIAHGIAPGVEGLVIGLERAASVSGSIALPAPAEHALVSACHFDATAQKELCVARQVVRPPEQRYFLDGLAPGAYDLVLEAVGYPVRRTSIQVAAGQRLAGPTLHPMDILTK